MSIDFGRGDYKPGSNVDKFWKNIDAQNIAGARSQEGSFGPGLTPSERNALEIARMKDQGALGSAGGFQPAGSPVQTSGRSNGSISSALTSAATYEPASYTPVGYEATTYTPVTPGVTQNELTSTQLNNLLSSDNPYIKRARLKGTEYANTRGLLNSTMGAQAAEAAAIDAAAPIAQSDANAYFQHAIQNAQAQNEAKRINAASQTAAAQYYAGQQNAANSHAADLQTAANEFKARANTDAVVNAIADAQKRGQTRLEASLNSAQEGTKQTAGLYAQYLQAASEINKADMNLSDKQAQINALRNAMVEGVNTTSNMYKSDFGNVDLEGSVPGEGAYIKNLYSAIDAALA